jgi:branched-chain amino acid transport system permease protein
MSTPAARIGRELGAPERLRWWEVALWVAAVAFYFLGRDYLSLSSQVLVMILFALSLDLVVGYAGLVTLGHGAFFGIGAYTAGILAARGWDEPVSALLLGGALAGAAGLLSGLVILRTRGLTFVMLTLALLMLLHEAANSMGWLTGGADGLSGIQLKPILGLFRFDIYGKTAYLYCLAVLFVGWCVVRTVVHSPFGRSVVGIRENRRRMEAIGTPVHGRLVMLYGLSAVLAGLAGALLAQTTQSVALTMIDLERSGTILVMLILGGVGRIYGAFVGVPLYMLAQDSLSKQDPTYWLFWLGIVLIAVVMFVRGGLLGIVDRLIGWQRRTPDR